jgi:hypothetical protein
MGKNQKKMRRLMDYEPLRTDLKQKKRGCAGDIAIRLRVLIPPYSMHYLELHRLSYGKQAKSSIIL